MIPMLAEMNWPKSAEAIVFTLCMFAFLIACVKGFPWQGRNRGGDDE